MVRRTGPQMRNCASGNIEIPGSRQGTPRNDILPIAVEMVVAVVIAAAAIAAIADPEHASDRAHGAADTGADCAADHTADRPGDPVAFPRALLGAAHDALGMPEPGKRQDCQNDW